MIKFDPQCIRCKHLIPAARNPFSVDGIISCEAFPLGIPEDLITQKVLHNKPYPGDNGIMYEAIED
jgi:hypothetical protein